MDAIFKKYKISKTKIINMVGMVHSSYCRTPSLGKKGNRPSKFTFHKLEGLADQNTVI